MNIREFSLNLQKCYTEMAETFANLQLQTNLPCLQGCGKCCLNPEIEASMLEMIPMALKIYDEGRLEEWLLKLEGFEDKACLMYDGQCISYNERPAICRMFAVGGYFNKRHELTLSICKFIKEEFTAESQSAFQTVKKNTPTISEWYAKLASLHPDLSKDRTPINHALLLALKKVALQAQYQ